jgi:hypothetical protein
VGSAALWRVSPRAGAAVGSAAVGSAALGRVSPRAGARRLPSTGKSGRGRRWCAGYACGYVWGRLARFAAIAKLTLPRGILRRDGAHVATAATATAAAATAAATTATAGAEATPAWRVGEARRERRELGTIAAAEPAGHVERGLRRGGEETFATFGPAALLQLLTAAFTGCVGAGAARYWTSDWETMYRFIKENDVPQLLEQRIHNGNMKQFLQENPEAFPAGLQCDRKYVIQVRKPTNK